MPTVSGTTGSPTNTQDGGDEIYEWTGSGSVTFSVGGTITHLIVAGGGGGAFILFSKYLLNEKSV